jgi:hypothetical protein
VRVRLGNPRSESPTELAILNQACSQVRNLLRFKRVTGNPWNFNDLLVDVIPNEATYQITQSDFGQPLAVLSWAPEQPTWIPRLIKIYEPQNLVLNIPAVPNQYASWGYLPYDNSNCTAQRCAFYWRNNIPYIEFWPLPLLQCQYKVRFIQNSNSLNTTALSESPLQNDECDLAEIRSAIALLPLAQWQADEGEGLKYNVNKRRELAASLAVEEREAARLFEAIARQPSGPRIYQRWNPTVG